MCTATYAGGNSLFGSGNHFFKYTLVHVIALGLRKCLKGSIRKHALFQTAWNHVGSKLSGDNIVGKLHGLDALFCVSHRCSNKEFVGTLFQNVCRFLDFSKIIIGSHVCFCK